jgi:CheY-like chemotaxis protein
MSTQNDHGTDGGDRRPDRRALLLATTAVGLMGAAESPFDWSPGAMVAVAAVVVGVCCATLILAAMAARAWRFRRRMASSFGWRTGATGDAGAAGAEPPAARRAKAMLDVRKTDASALDWPAVETGDVSATAAEEAGAASGPAKTILVADDDPVVAFALKRRLEQLGYDVLRSPDSAHALLGAMKMTPDLVILDVNMPGGNGLAVCEMMASDPRYAGIPVIIHSTLADETTRRRCENLGARHVEKSRESWNQIRSLVESLLGGATRGGDAVNPAPIEAAPLLLPVCGRPRALCIDGSRGELQSVQRELIALGVDTVRVSDLGEGFWTCFSENPHVILVHTDAPNEEVEATLLRLWQHPVTRKIPILVLADKPLNVTELPDDDNLTILDGKSTWERLRQELEGLLPIVDKYDADLLARRGRPGTDAETSAATETAGGEAATSGEPPRTPESDEKHLKILCIDDDPVIAKSIALRLKPYGIEVIAAHNGTQGFYVGLREQPDLILLDLQMPEGEGNYTLNRFQAHSRAKEIPIVILTVETNPGARRGLIASGAVGFLSKPVRWRDFVEELGRHVPLPPQVVHDYRLSEEELRVPL